MLNLIKNIIFFWKKPKVVVLTNGDREIVKRIVSQILGSSFQIEKEILFTDSIEEVDFSNKNYLILNFDDTGIRKPREKESLRILTFGFKEGADFRATDLKQNGGVNFKVNYRGNIVPIWFKEPAGQKEIYSVLTAIAVGIIFDLNLVEISQALKEY